MDCQLCCCDAVFAVLGIKAHAILDHYSVHLLGVRDRRLEMEETDRSSLPVAVEATVTHHRGGLGAN